MAERIQVTVTLTPAERDEVVRFQASEDALARNYDAPWHDRMAHQRAASTLAGALHALAVRGLKALPKAKAAKPALKASHRKARGGK